MPNYFYTDASGQKQGPINEVQLQAMATRGVITPDTPLETDTGHIGTAGQIPGLKFNTVIGGTKTDQMSIMSIKSWLFDFAFNDIRLHIINRLICKIIYAISWVSWIVPGLIAISNTLIGLSDGSWSLGDAVAVMVIVTPISYIFATPFILMFIIMARLVCEWYIIMFDWIVETTKAARIYIKEKQGE